MVESDTNWLMVGANSVSVAQVCYNTKIADKDAALILYKLDFLLGDDLNWSTLSQVHTLEATSSPLYSNAVRHAHQWDSAQ